MEPIIKWSGSKRSQAKQIVDTFPDEIDTYYEPFCGSCAVLFELMTRVFSSEKKVKRFVCSDINNDLIETWKLVKNDPKGLMSFYTNHYDFFSKNGIKEKKEFYNYQRDLFNLCHLNKYYRFFWLRRTCYNGLVRYNKKGEFNAPCHFTRDGIEPDKLRPIMEDWSYMLNKYDVEFSAKSYTEIGPIGNNDLVYLDPPYANTNGMYMEDTFDKTKFFKWVKKLPRFVLSYDGKTDEKDSTQDLSKVLKYDEHLYLESGKSSFSKFKNKDVSVKESLYIKK